MLGPGVPGQDASGSVQDGHVGGAVVGPSGSGKSSLLRAGIATHLHLWWYAAAAVVAGAVLALVVATLQTASSGTVTPPVVTYRDYPHHIIWKACFAMPHQPSIELARQGCAGAR